MKKARVFVLILGSFLICSVLSLHLEGMTLAEEAGLAATNGGTTTLISRHSDGTQGNGDTSLVPYYPSISADGRFVAFNSNSTNLVDNDTNGDITDIFVHDRQTGDTTLVSRHSDGTQGNNGSIYPSISADGRFVTFQSMATNLVDDDVKSASWDIFVHDRQTGETTLVSRHSDGTQGKDRSDYPSISADGRFVAFQSKASNLVDDYTPYWFDDIFLHDRQTGKTTLISRHLDGPGVGASFRPSISADGRFVAFNSNSTNLVDNDTNGDITDIFVHDRQTGDTTLVSRHSDGTQGNNGSIYPSISADGRFVAFQSEASNLVDNDTNGERDVFIHDLQTGETTLVSRHSDGAPGDSTSYIPSISADGRFVAFFSYASNLVDNYINGYGDVFVHDRQTGETTLISHHSDGTQGNNTSACPSVSADGQVVAFQSDASNLVDDDTNGYGDFFVHDRGESVPVYSISGSVKDSQGNPIANVIISAGSENSGSTDANGDYTIVGLTAGTYTLTPQKDEYTFNPTFSADVRVPGDINKSWDFLAIKVEEGECRLAGFGDDAGLPLKQTDPKWATIPYGGYLDPKTNEFFPFVWDGVGIDNIGHWGCTMTSAAMIVNYFAQQQSVPFETNPKELNRWLQENGGFISGAPIPNSAKVKAWALHPDNKDYALAALVGDKYVSSGFVSAAKVAEYAKEKTEHLHNGPILFNPTGSIAGRNDPLVISSVCEGNPVILNVIKPGYNHYVVASGSKSKTQFEDLYLHDPLADSILSLKDSWRGTYTKHNIYRGEQNLSARMTVGLQSASAIALSAVRDYPLQFLVTDASGRRTGYDPVRDTVVNEIPNARYYLESLTSSDGASTMQHYEFTIEGSDASYFALDVVGAGSYALSFSGVNNQSQISSFSVNGSSTLEVPATHVINYTPDSTNPVSIQSKLFLPSIVAQ